MMSRRKVDKRWRNSHRPTSGPMSLDLSGFARGRATFLALRPRLRSHFYNWPSWRSQAAAEEVGGGKELKQLQGRIPYVLHGRRFSGVSGSIVSRNGRLMLADNNLLSASGLSRNSV